MGQPSKFSKNLGLIVNESVGKLVSECEEVICSTSWDSDLELNAIKKFSEAGKKSIAYIDHWVNYLERFQRSDFVIYPTEIWVTDDYSYQKAITLFKLLDVKNVGNPYLDYMVAKVMNKVPQKKRSMNILYVSEPIREHALRQHGNERFWGYTEEEALLFFLDNLGCLTDTMFEITLRLHPSESKEKYADLLLCRSEKIVISEGTTLYNDISNSDIVVGCETMAMVVALMSDRKVICSIPLVDKECSLPHLGINKLTDLLTS